MKGVAETLFLLGTLVAFGLLVVVWAFSTPGALERLLPHFEGEAGPEYRDGGEVAGEEDIYKNESMRQRGSEGGDDSGNGSAVDDGGSGDDNQRSGGSGGDELGESINVVPDGGLPSLYPSGLPSVEVGDDREASETLSTVVSKGGLNE
jgi:hypothetical protein